MGIETALIVGGLGLAAGGTAYSMSQSKKAAKAGAQAAEYQRQAAQIQAKQNDLQAARQRREAVRQARIAAAQAEMTGVNQGVSGSSASQGGVGSIVSQANANLSFLDQYNFLSDQAGVALGKGIEAQSNANMHAAKAQTGSAIAGLGMTLFTQSSPISSKINKVFGG